MTDVERLEAEAAYFEEHRQEFVDAALGKYVLIKGQQAHGFYDDPLEAYHAGVVRFGLEPFSIKEVLPQDRMYAIPAFSHGLTHAVI